jgi:IclR family transcriptional regulator, KDG regulon repressor
MRKSLHLTQETPSIAVVRALSILEAVAGRANGLTNSEIALRMKIPKSSASYILRALESAGFVRRNRETGKYHLGSAVISLGHRALAGLDIRQIAQPVLRNLVERYGFSAHLAILDRGQAMYIERFESSGFVRMNTWIGRRMDLHSTAVGKVLAAHLPKDEAEALFRGKDLTRYTPDTITLHGRLMKELEKVKVQGYGVDDEENSVGVRCVAVPVFNAEGSVEAAVGVTSIVGELEKAALPKIAEHLKVAARKISTALGHGSMDLRP